MATIRDVAQTAGVSIQTVSNYLHGKPSMRPETQQRVQVAIAQLNYRPSSVAQGMRRQFSQALGMLISDPNPRGLADPFYGEVLAGLCAVTGEHNFSLLIDILPSDRPLHVHDVLKSFQTRRIDAAVIFLPGAEDQHVSILSELVQANVPFALLEREVEGDRVYSVLAANYEGARTATQRLIAAGHRRVAFLHSTQRWPSVDWRWQGYQAAMREQGLQAHIAAFTSPDWTAAGGGIAAARLLESSDATRPTALLAGSDVLAVGALQILKARGLRIPDDVALIGFDDFEFARYVDPPLTTVRLPAFAMGRRAAELLIDHLQGRPASERRVVLPTELIVRQSTAP